ANTVDHIVAHRGDTDLFWDKDNWQPLCGPCHSADKQKEEAAGF
ncbi:TPA: HNH endonuclease, partial [Pseudomonas aeruginosa]|nr:HNH endonuclease [Pseudomonas aeruginosa]